MLKLFCDSCRKEIEPLEIFFQINPSKRRKISIAGKLEMNEELKQAHLCHKCFTKHIIPIWKK